MASTHVVEWTAGEPVSPELVLVDAELARRERARLNEQAVLAAEAGLPRRRMLGAHDLAQLRAAVDTPLPLDRVPMERREWVRPLAAGVGALAFLAAGLGVALVLFGHRTTETVVLGTSDHGVASSPVMHEAVTPQARVRLTTPHLLERRILTLLAAGSAAKIPSPLLDPATGLLKNNTEVTCRRASVASYTCLVRPATHGPGEGLRVDYRVRPAHDGVFVWHGYRRARAGHAASRAIAGRPIERLNAAAAQGPAARARVDCPGGVAPCSRSTAPPPAGADEATS